jgi:hypothetical protein
MATFTDIAFSNNEKSHEANRSQRPAKSIKPGKPHSAVHLRLIVFAVVGVIGVPWRNAIYLAAKE